MPGLIGLHVPYTDINGLHDALLFGVTTELEMNGRWTPKERRKIAERDDIADLRSPGMGITPKGGHPTQYMSSSNNSFLRFFYRYPLSRPLTRQPSLWLNRSLKEQTTLQDSY